MTRLRRDAGDRLKALRIFIGLGVCADVCSQILDLSLRIDQLIGEQAQGLVRRCGQVRLLTSNNQTLDVVDALRHDNAKFAQMRPHHAGGVLSARRIDDVRLLAQQKFPCVALEAHLWCDVGHQ